MNAQDIVSLGDALDPGFSQVLARIRRGSVISSLAEIERILAGYKRVRTIDLIGHSATTDRLLRLGRDLIDMRSWKIAETFQRLAWVFRKLGTHEIRLLGCSTAVTVAARRTLKDLARALYPIKIYGTVDFVAARHFDERGLRRRYERMLIAASDLP